MEAYTQNKYLLIAIVLTFLNLGKYCRFSIKEVYKTILLVAVTLFPFMAPALIFKRYQKMVFQIRPQTPRHHMNQS